MPDQEQFPRPLRKREQDWLRFLLPESSKGFDRFYKEITELGVLGEGRWGRYDYVLGKPGQEIDRTEGMQPVKAYGELQGK